MKKAIGYALLSLPFAAPFGVMAYVFGPFPIFIGFGVAALIVGCIAAGVCLIIN